MSILNVTFYFYCVTKLLIQSKDNMCCMLRVRMTCERIFNDSFAHLLSLKKSESSTTDLILNIDLKIYLLLYIVPDLIALFLYYTCMLICVYLFLLNCFFPQLREYIDDTEDYINIQVFYHFLCRLRKNFI